jgi:amino acid transporter
MENEENDSISIISASMDDDEARLRKLGYRQEFQRSLTSFSNFGLAFTILSIPASLLPFIYLGLETGGPRAMLITWPVVSIASVFVGLSMAEIVSSFPTSGGLYFWAAKLAPKGWAPVLSFYTGVFNFLGLWGLGSGTAYEVGVLAVSLLYVPGYFDIKQIPSTDFTYRSIVVLVSFLVLLLCGYLNTLSSKAMNQIGQICLWINIVGLAMNVLGTAYIGDVPRLSLSELLQNWSNTTGFPDAYALFISLLPAAMTYTGYDSAAHMAEETIGAAVSAPIAIISSILLAFPIGFLAIWSLLAPVPAAMYDTIARSPNTTSTVVDIFVYTQGITGGFLQTLVLTIATLTCPYAIIGMSLPLSNF